MPAPARDGQAAARGPPLPSRTLPTARNSLDAGIASFLAANGYEGVVEAVPSPPGDTSLTLELVDGRGMPAPGQAAVETVEAEVSRVVDMVIDRALTRPEESLAVIALNRLHADALRSAITRAAAGASAHGARERRQDEAEPPRDRSAARESRRVRDDGEGASRTDGAGRAETAEEGRGASTEAGNRRRAQAGAGPRREARTGQVPPHRAKAGAARRRAAGGEAEPVATTRKIPSPGATFTGSGRSPFAGWRERAQAADSASARED